MSQTLLLSPLGVFPDVCLSAWGLTVTFKQSHGPLVVQRRTLQDALSLDEIDTGMPDSTFPRLVSALTKTWLAYRAFRDGQESAVVREVFQIGLGPENVLGPTFGNNPVCLSSDGLVAWQDQAGAVHGLRLADGETLILRLETRPTGLSHLQADHPVFVDENRLSEPGMLNPVRSGALTVGEGPATGLRARIGPKFGEVLGGECFTPRCADLGENQYAAVTWGPGIGASLVLFIEADIVELPPIPPVPPPIPLDQIEALDGELLVAWYEMRQPPATLPPGNAEIAVGHPPGYPVGTVRPRPVLAMMSNMHDISPVFSVQVGSEGMHDDQGMLRLEALAAELHQQGIRPFVYWDELFSPRPLQLPAGSVYAFPAYCGRNQPLNTFEASIRSAIIEHSQHYDFLLMACQTHTTNEALIAEPSRAIPSYIRLIQEFRQSAGGKLIGVSIFNNSGRDFPDGSKGGLTANPQLRPHWEKAFSNCTFPNWLLGGNDGGGGGVADPVVEFIDHARTYARNDPQGLRVQYDISSERPITQISFRMVDDGEPPIVIKFEGLDGRYYRGSYVKVVRNGRYHPQITATDDQGRSTTQTSPLDVEVTEGGGPLPPGLIAPNVMWAVQQAMNEHPEIDPMDEVARGRILDFACVITGNPAWGRKARNEDGTNKNTDGMCFKRSDGKHEIYDAISGGNGSATWEGFGPFNPGENGWWAPHEPV